MTEPEWDDDADNAALIAAQNRPADEHGDPNAADPGSYEEHALADPPPPPPDTDDFSDLDDGDDDDEDLDDE